MSGQGNINWCWTGSKSLWKLLKELFPGNRRWRVIQPFHFYNQNEGVLDVMWEVITYIEGSSVNHQEEVPEGKTVTK